MELWWRLAGWVRVRLTSADCAGRLGECSKIVTLVRIEFPDELTAEFTLKRTDLPRLKLRDGESLREVGRGGLPKSWALLLRWRALTVAAILLGALTVFLSGRILFVTVEGNDAVPERLILEQSGICFGDLRRDVRGEQVKNHLLRAIPELRWAGVNTSGCVATITVAERSQEPAAEPVGPGDVVANQDAVVASVTTEAGTALVKPGQAVRAGEILISGTTDLGLCTRLDRAEGEVYGVTCREITAVLPDETCIRGELGPVKRKISLRIGKKSVNFSFDSGILPGTCVKMRTVQYLTLPGGFRLPVALVTDTWQITETELVSRTDGDETLADAAQRYALEQKIAGQILRAEEAVLGNTLSAVYECRELIGVFRPGMSINIEGDTNERKNGERGTG